MPTEVLRPNGSVAVPLAGSASSIVGGAGSAHAATNDNSDSTYFNMPGGASNSNEVTFDFADTAIPSTAQIRSVTPRIRVDNLGIGLNGGAGQHFKMKAGGFDESNEAVPAQSGFGTLTMTARSTAHGVPWTLSLLNALQVYFRFGGAGTSTLRIAELYLDVLYNMPPTATGVGPSGTVTTTRPAVSWTYSDPEGDAQERYRVKVFSAAQYGAVGFDPNTATPTADSGEVVSSATSWTCSVDLQNGVTYRAFIAVSDVGSNGRYSAITTSGPYVQFTVDMPPPAVPELTAVADAAGVRHVLTLQDRQSLLTADAFSFETATGGWTALSNCTIARVVDTAEEGTAVLRLTATAAATMQALSSTTSFPVVPGRVYSARVGFRSAAVVRQVRCDIKFYDAGGSLLTTVGGVDHASIVGSFVPSFCTATAPANAVYAAVVATVISPNNTEVHYIDTATLVPFALNMVNNPIFEIDTNADGVADEWLAYSAGAGSATRSLDTNVMFAGLQSQRIDISGQVSVTDWKGVTTQTGVYTKSGQQYTISAWVRSSQAMTIELWHSYAPAAGGAVIPANTWTRVTHTFTANASGPATLYVRSNYIGVATLWVGHVQMELGSAASTAVCNRKPWVRGGVLSAQRFEVQRSGDGGVTWSTLNRLFWGTLDQTNYDEVDVSDLYQSLVAVDYEAPRGVVPTYRVRSKATVSGNSLASQWSSWATAAALAVSGWHMKSLTDATKNITLNVHNGFLTWQSDERQSVVYALGRANPIVLADAVSGERCELELSFIDEAPYASFETLRKRQEVMLLQSSEADHRYVRFGATRAATHMLTGGGTRKRIVKTSLIEVDAP